MKGENAFTHKNRGSEARIIIGGSYFKVSNHGEAADSVDGKVLREISTGFSCTALEGKYFRVTGTGKYFKNVQVAPEVNLGLVRLTNGGETAQLLWGFADGGKFTSEFPAHMMSHAARLKIDPQNHVVMHGHPANLLAMTYVHSLDEKAFTRTLWQMCMVFPDGVNVLPWMLCGTHEIGIATAEKMQTARLVVWAQHGIYGAGKDLDETFGLIKTAEKAAEIYRKIRPPAPAQSHHRRRDAPAGGPFRREGTGRVSVLISRRCNGAEKMRRPEGKPMHPLNRCCTP